VTVARARQALQLLRVPGNDEEVEKSAIELFDDLQIYPGSKLTHFRALHAKTSIPYKQMVRHRLLQRLYGDHGISCSCFSTTSRGTAKLKSWASFFRSLQKNEIAHSFGRSGFPSHPDRSRQRHIQCWR
jgi:hypothetical protein